MEIRVTEGWLTFVESIVVANEDFQTAWTRIRTGMELNTRWGHSPIFPFFHNGSN